MMKMMRKILALLAALMLTASFAMAEETITVFSAENLVDITLTLKDGDHADFAMTESVGSVRLTVSRPGCATVTVNVASAEMSKPVSLGELSNEALQNMIEQEQNEWPGAVITTEKTDAGALYLHIKSDQDENLQDIYTLYEGYYVELIQFHDDFAALTDADDAFLMDVLRGIWTKQS